MCASGANIPRKAADLRVNLGGGKTVALSQYSGKVVAALFILTTCPHCQAAVRCFSQEQNALGARGFQAIASVVEPSAARNVAGFVRQFQPPFPVGYSERRDALDFMQHARAAPLKMPMVAFIDRAGTVRAQYEGYEDFFAEDRMAKNIHAKLLELIGPAGSGKRAAAPQGKRKDPD